MALCFERNWKPLAGQKGAKGNASKNTREQTISSCCKVGKCNYADRATIRLLYNYFF